MRTIEQAVVSWVTALALGCGGSASAGAEPTQAVEKPGLRCIGSACFPVPDGAVPVPLPGGDFETEGKIPAGWALGGGQIVTADDAPQGKNYYRFPARKGTILITPRDLDLPGGQPYFFSLWLKCPEDHWTCIGFRCDESLRTIGDHYPGIPGTDNHWKRVGYYVWMPTQAKGLHLQIQPHKDSPEGQFIAVDDVRLRTATAAEMSAAYDADRQALPPYGATPRPDDGRHLALSVAKWEGRAGLPGKPFVIWAVGSSWTNFQGDGYPLIRAIRERFPAAPPIIYKKHAGSGTPWDFARGWVQQMVIPEQPDLVFSGACPSNDEIMRVLSPLGVAYVHRDGQWTKTIKPWPQEMDQWTHWCHAADNNAVARDTQVGPPHRMQWVAEPLWSRGHELISSVGAAVTARGRLVYVLDEGQPGVYELPSRWVLVARNAFNGVLLWKKPVPEWGPPVARGGHTGGFRPRRLVTDGERLYLPLGEAAVLTSVDAATGKTLKTLDSATGTSEILCQDGLLVAVVSARAKGPATLLAAHPETLDVLWQM